VLLLARAAAWTGVYGAAPYVRPTHKDGGVVACRVLASGMFWLHACHVHYHITPRGLHRHTLQAVGLVHWLRGCTWWWWWHWRLEAELCAVRLPGACLVLWGCVPPWPTACQQHICKSCPCACVHSWRRHAARGVCVCARALQCRRCVACPRIPACLTRACGFPQCVQAPPPPVCVLCRHTRACIEHMSNAAEHTQEDCHSVSVLCA
jgi:hypothetical protein